MANGEAYGPYRSGLSVTFPNDVLQRTAPLERQLDRQFREQMYDRRIREQRRRENAEQRRRIFEFNPNVLAGEYQGYFADKIQNELLPYASRVYRGDTLPSEASEAEVYKRIGDIRKEAAMVNDFSRSTNELYKQLKEGIKSGFIAEGPAMKKFDLLYQKENGRLRKPEELDFDTLENFMQDDSIKNVGKYAEDYYNTLEKEYMYTRTVPTSFGKTRSQDVLVTYNDIYEDFNGDGIPDIDDSGKLIPRANKEMLFKIRQANREYYDLIVRDAELEDASPLDILKRHIMLYGGGLSEEIKRSSTISPDQTTSPSKYGIPEEDVVRTEGRVDFIHDVVTGAYPAGLKAINGVEYSGDRLSGVITSADVVDKDVYSADYQGPRKKKMFVITYRDDRYPGMPSKTIEIDITTPEGQEEAGQLFNNIMSKELKGTKGQVYPENFRKVWKFKYGTRETDDPLEIL